VAAGFQLASLPIVVMLTLICFLSIFIVYFIPRLKQGHQPG
jgi:hypothetical protein